MPRQWRDLVKLISGEWLEERTYLIFYHLLFGLVWYLIRRPTFKADRVKLNYFDIINFTVSLAGVNTGYNTQS